MAVPFSTAWTILSLNNSYTQKACKVVNYVYVKAELMYDEMLFFIIQYLDFLMQHSKQKSPV